MKFPAFDPIDLKNEYSSSEMVDLYLAQITPNENQPRKYFCKNSLEELAASIKQHGIIQPILVKELQKGKKYQIIAGERRWRAAKMAELEKIPAIIKEDGKANRLAMALIENIQRENLSPLEEALAIQSLLEECHLTHIQIAESLGKSRTTITNLLRLLSLTVQVKEMISSGLLEMGHARALLTLSSDQQITIANQVVSQSLSVRETEKVVQRIHHPKQTKHVILDSQLQIKMEEWSKQFSQRLASEVVVCFNQNGSGKVVINFSSLDEADLLMSNLILESKK